MKLIECEPKHSNIVTKHSNIVTKHSNIVTKHSNIVTKWTNFKTQVQLIVPPPPFLMCSVFAKNFKNKILFIFYIIPVR